MSVSKKIRVIECIRQGQIGGGESHLLSLVENLDRGRFEPIVLSFTDGPMISRLKEMDVETHVIHTERPFDFGKWKQVKALLKDKQVDLVHAHGTRANSNVLWPARWLNIPVIYTVHGWSFHPDQHPLVRRIRILGEKLLTSRTDLNISVSASNQQSGKEYIRSFRSIVVNNGIDQKKFNAEGSYRDIRKELGIPETDVLVLFIARFTSHKQPLALVRAFASIANDNPHIHLLMVGDGDEKEQAKQLTSENGLEKRITLQPFRHDVPAVLAAADIFVLPSLWEGLPIGLLEALAMGKAVIASNVDGAREIIRHNVNGILVEPGKDLVNNLAKALASLSNDKHKREEFRRQAIATVKEKYNAGQMTRQIEQIYLELLAGQSVQEPKLKLNGV